MSQQSFHQQTATGNDINFTIDTFKSDEIKVYVDGVLKTAGNHYNITPYNPNGQSQLAWIGTKPSSPSIIRIVRETDILNAGNNAVEGKATYAAGSSVKADDLNNNQKQVLRALQEHNDQLIQTYDIEDSAVTRAKIKDSAIDTSKLDDNAVRTAKIADGEVTTAKIADSNVTTAKIANDAITSAKLATNSVDSNALATNAVTDGNILASAVTTAKIAADAVNGTKIADNSINSEHYVDGSIDREHLVADIIDGTKIADDSINSEHYADASIDEQHIANSAVTSNKIADDAVGTTEIANGSVTTAKLPNAAVTSAKIADNNVTTAKIADSNVTTAKIADGAINNSKLGPDCITQAKIADGEVRVEHLGSSSVTTAKIADSNVTTAKIADDAVNGDKIAANSIQSQHYVDGSIQHEHLANNIIDGDNIQDDVVNSEHIAAGALDNEHYAAGSITADKLNGATVVTNSEQSGYSVNDTSFFTTSAAEARYFNASTGETIKDGQAFPDNDTTIATTAAINDRIIDLVDDVGGFVPIANETSFPNANPDVNNGTGTIVSISTLASNHTSNGSGTFTISNGTVGNSTVTITGAANNTTYSAGYGLLVETTTTLNTYTFHRLVPKATEITTVAGKATEIGRLGTADAVADMAILGTADVVSDLNTLGTADVVADMNMLAVSDVISDMNTLAVTSVLNNIDTVATNVSNVNTTAGSISNVNTAAGSISNINTVAGINANVTTVAGISSNVTSVANNSSNINSAVSNASNINSAVSNASNINTVAGSISNVNTTAGSISNVNSVASNMANVNNFADRYQIAANNPSTDGGGNALAAGDLYFNTSANELKVYNGSSWQGGVTASGSFASTTGNTFTGDNRYNDGVKALFGTGSDLEIYHDGSHSYIKDVGTGNLYIRGDDTLFIQSASGEDKLKATTNGSVELYYDNSKKFETTASGVNISSGNLQIGGTNVINSGRALYNLDSLKLADSKIAYFGSSNDLQIYHDGSNSYVENATGELRIKSSAQLLLQKHGTGESMVRAVPDNTVELRYDNSTKLQTTSAGVSVTGTFTASSTVNAGGHFKTNSDWNGFICGAGDDLQIYHDGTNSRIHSASHNLYLRSGGDFGVFNGDGSETMLLASPNGSVELYHNNSKKLDTHSGGINVTGSVNPTGNVALVDNSKVKLGTGDDLLIFHDGTNSSIQNGTGTLRLRGDSIKLNNNAASENYLVAAANGSVELYYDNSKKFETYASGVAVMDSVKYAAGNSADLEIYHDGSNTYLNNSTGILYLRNMSNDSLDVFSNGSARIRVNGGEIGVDVSHNSSVDLYYDNSKKFETTSTGATVTGALAATSLSATGGITGTGGNFILGDSAGTGNNKIKLGASGDLEIHHDGTNTNIDNDTGDLKISSSGTLRLRGDNVSVQNMNQTETMGYFATNGAAKLYYDNAEKIQTTSGGAQINGSLGVVGNTNINSGSSGGNLTIMGGATYPGGAIKFTGGTASENNHIKFYGGQQTSLEERMVLTRTGELGIGTSSPTERLHVNNSVTFTGLKITSTNNSTRAMLEMSGRDSSGVPVQLKMGGFGDTSRGEIFTVSNHALGFATNNAAAQMTLDTSGNLNIPNDSGKIRLGASQDLQLYHDGTDNYIESTGKLYLKSSNFVDIRSSGNETMIKAIPDGAVELYYDNSKKLETTSYGVAFVDEAKFDNDTNAGRDVIWDPANDQMRWLDNTKVAIGTGSDLQIYHDGSHTRVNHSGTGQLVISGNDNDQVKLMKGTSEEGVVLNNNGNVELYYNNSKKFETTTDGVGIGKSSTSLDSDGAIFSGSGQHLQIVKSGSGGNVLVLNRRTNVGLSIEFYRGSSVGSVSHNNTSTSYNTTSDYRLKENVVTLSNAITRLKTLKPYRFNFIADKDVTVDGFMAHEVTATVPEAIQGEKDAVVTQAMVDNEEYAKDRLGDIIPQGIDQAKLVPLLTAALQEAISKIEVLETKVAALEAA